MLMKSVVFWVITRRRVVITTRRRVITQKTTDFNSQTCFGLYTTITGVITRWKDVGELIKNGVNLNSFVHFDGSFIHVVRGTLLTESYITTL